MAAPNYRDYGGYRDHGGYPARPPETDVRRKVERERRGRELRERRDAARRRRSFVLLVVVPALLMFGSVYLHDVAADTRERITAVEERIDQAETRYKQLGVREAELSSPERIRSLAGEDHGLQDADASQIEAVEAR